MIDNKKIVKVKIFFGKYKGYITVDKSVYNAYLFLFLAMIMFSCTNFHFGFKVLDSFYLHRYLWLAITFLCSIYLGLKNFSVKELKVRSNVFLWDLIFVLIELLMIYIFPPKFVWKMPVSDDIYIIKMLFMGIIYEFMSKHIMTKFFIKENSIT